jgi:hypothetical protein
VGLPELVPPSSFWILELGIFLRRGSRGEREKGRKGEREKGGKGERQLRAKGVEVLECVVRAKAPSPLRFAGAVHNGRRELWSLELGAWDFFGIWDLDFGVSEQRVKV